MRVDGTWEHLAGGRWVRTFPAPAVAKPAEPRTDPSGDDGSSNARWLQDHAGMAFVPARAPKARSKLSKFEGAKPGWVFKTGERGLGY